MSAQSRPTSRIQRPGVSAAPAVCIFVNATQHFVDYEKRTSISQRSKLVSSFVSRKHPSPSFRPHLTANPLFVSYCLDFNAAFGSLLDKPGFVRNGTHLILRCNEPLTPASTFSFTLAKLLVLVQGHYVSRITTIGSISPTFTLKSSSAFPDYRLNTRIILSRDSTRPLRLIPLRVSLPRAKRYQRPLSSARILA